jgi:hypothetical protein
MIVRLALLKYNVPPCRQQDWNALLLLKIYCKANYSFLQISIFKPDVFQERSLQMAIH